MEKIMYRCGSNVAVLALLFLTCGCEANRQESGVAEEDSVVIETTPTPDRRETEIVPAETVRKKPVDSSSDSSIAGQQPDVPTTNIQPPSAGEAEASVPIVELEPSAEGTGSTNPSVPVVEIQPPKNN
jgi:hypothetical protein